MVEKKIKNIDEELEDQVDENDFDEFFCCWTDKEVIDYKKFELGEKWSQELADEKWSKELAVEYIEYLFNGKALNAIQKTFNFLK